MGIDDIGTKGPAAPPPVMGGVPSATETGRPFELGTVQPLDDAASVGVAEPSSAALDQLRAGQIGHAAYLNIKVEEATAHLSGLPAPALEAIRSGLRDRLACDPTLIELVRTATGHLPEPPKDP